ncbi:dihydrofolate reductase family protein [Haladaptatus caseinilyticus]|uniref:dihydrofolate reductase family protein n=1 Tax=Haladaptatus caseinilyticus TaxID=2993314 RepID=UPI003898DE4F
MNEFTTPVYKHFVQGDVTPVHAEMVTVADGKNIWLVRGGDLVGQFYDHGLLDEIILNVAPVTLASGAPLLSREITISSLNWLACRNLAMFLRF